MTEEGVDNSMSYAVSEITRRTSARSLTFSLEAELIRAVSVKRLMERFGYHLRSGYLDGADKADRLYHLAHKVEKYDYFVSHEWGTGRLQKLLALCAYNNLLPAVAVSFVVAVVAMLLEGFGVLPSWGTRVFIIADQEIRGRHSRWSLVVAPVAYILTFLYWQHFRFWFRLRIADVFFDRFSVDQTNDTLKAAAIMGLGGFIRLSKRFVILWSPRYFERLWCVYEVATWTYLQRPDAMMAFIPVNVVVRLLGGQCVCFVASVFNSILTESTAVQIVIPSLVVACVTILAFKTLHDVIEDLLRVQDQLTGFTLERAACHCCSVNHRDDKSGNDISCDRALVSQTIANWFNSNASRSHGPDQTERGLSRFESYVRKDLSAKVIHKVIGRPQVLILVALTVYPWFWYTCGELSFEVSLENNPYRWRMIVDIFGYLIVYIPLGVRFTILTARWMTMNSSSWSPYRRGLRRISIFMLTCIVWGLSCGLPAYARQEESSAPYVIVSCVLVGALGLLCRMKVFDLDALSQRPMGKSSASEPVIVGRQPNVTSNDLTMVECGVSTEVETWYF